MGRATYDAAQEIRNGKSTEEGIKLVKQFDGEYLPDLKRNYLNICQ